MSKKILILGASGFVGSNLTTALEKLGHTVYRASRTLGVDITDYGHIEQCLRKFTPDIIFNCAAHVGSLHYVTTYAADVIHDNVQMSLNLYKAVATVCPKTKIINPLSNCSYPGTSAIQTESEWWSGEVHDSVFSYGNAKRILYVIATCYQKQHKIHSVNFLIPNTFGPGDSTDPNKTHALNGMIIRMIEAQKRGDTEFEIWGTGSPVREWAYIDDVVHALIHGMEIDKDTPHPINIAQQKGFTIKQTAEFIAEAVHFTGKLVFNTSYADGAPVKILDDKKFRQLFPDFIFSDHKKGIAATVAYYKSIL